MTFDISKYPEPEDYGEVLLRLMASPHRRPAPVFPRSENLTNAKAGDDLVLIGAMTGDMQGSLYAREWLKLEGKDLGQPPKPNTDAEQKTSNFIRFLIENGLVNAVQKISGGGIACASAHMTLVGNLKLYIELDSGSAINWPRSLPFARLDFMFGEPPCCYLLATPRAEQVYKLAEDHQIPASWLGLGGLWSKDDISGEVDWQRSDYIVEEDFVGIHIDLALSSLREADENRKAQLRKG